MLCNTSANGILTNKSTKYMISEGTMILPLLLIASVQKFSKFLYVYIEVRNAILFHLLNIFYKNTDSEATIAVSRESDCSANGPRFQHKPLPPLFGQNQGTCARCECIRNNFEHCFITLACASVIKSKNHNRNNEKKFCNLSTQSIQTEFKKQLLNSG